MKSWPIVVSFSVFAFACSASGALACATARGYFTASAGPGRMHACAKAGLPGAYRSVAFSESNAAREQSAQTRRPALRLPPFIAVSLGGKIPVMDIRKYVESGNPRFSYSILSQTMPGSIQCSLDGSLLTCGYAYRAGINTVTLEAVDSTNARARATIGIRVDAPLVANRVYGLDFAPNEGLRPQSEISADQIIRRMAMIAPYTRWIRTFTSTHGLENVGAIAHRFGLSACMGAWITKDMAANAAEMANLIEHARKGEADCAIVGSETLYRNDATPAVIAQYIHQFRDAVPHVPVATADAYLSFINNPQVVNDCDFIFVNYYPYWEGIDIGESVPFLNAEDLLLRRAFPGKEVIVSETGWPTAGNTIGSGVPSTDHAESYFLNFESWARLEKRKAFYFEAFDEPGKGISGDPQEAHFGVFDQAGSMKYGNAVFAGKTVPDNWSCKARVGGAGAPSLQLDSVTLERGVRALRGRVSHVVPAEYYLVVYIHFKILGWWVKPLTTLPLTPIKCNGSWKTDIGTNKRDVLADRIAAFLIPSAYSPPVLRGAHELPAELYKRSLANGSMESRISR